MTYLSPVDFTSISLTHLLKVLLKVNFICEVLNNRNFPLHSSFGMSDLFWISSSCFNLYRMKDVGTPG